ncbi:hypothetical protein C8Q80DRAFT_922082 [Daedaleopsis nitida]|nr:hypothetical protein C8Q80DRAFT_922082 [Daedaleopsis nitida]
MLECTICCGSAHVLARLTFVVSNNSQYPFEHVFTSTYHDHPPAWLARVLREIPSLRCLTVGGLVQHLLARMSRTMSSYISGVPLASEEEASASSSTTTLAICESESTFDAPKGDLQQAICSRPETVDLLVSLTYIAAEAGVLDPSPTGIGLYVRSRGTSGDLVHFDTLSLAEMCIVVRDLISTLPSVTEMKAYFERAPHDSCKALEYMNPSVSAAAWRVLRWSVMSCDVPRVEELCDPLDKVQNIGSGWKQFRICARTLEDVDEARFQCATAMARIVDHNTKVYPSLYAFHGSPLDSWHSILRHGLWYRKIRHGRKYGDGVYLSKEGTIAESYTNPPWGGSQWKNSGFNLTACMTLAEVVNQPSRFVYEYKTHCPKSKSNKKSAIARNVFVVDKTEWIRCRYLFVQSQATSRSAVYTSNVYAPSAVPLETRSRTGSIRLDPLHLPTMSKIPIVLPAC